jgi:hypothetical protein
MEGQQMTQGIHRHMDLGAPTALHTIIAGSGATFGRHLQGAVDVKELDEAA